MPTSIWKSRRRLSAATVLLGLIAAPGEHLPNPAGTPAQAEDATPANAAALRAQYQERLREYQEARQKYEAVAQPYWQSVTEKRRNRIAKRNSGQAITIDDYVLAQPPAYAGPPKPENPFPEPQPTPPGTAGIPVVADFLRCAAEQYQFTPNRPQSEADFKRAYARVAAPAGITSDQAVRIYGFEAGGNGNYDVQAGLEGTSPSAHAVSTALGYNQLLHTNSVELLAEQGDRFLKVLENKRAGLSGKAKHDFEAKLHTVRQMVAFAKSVPDDWSQHEKLANTPKGLAVHALNLDLDVGPLLQSQKLLDSIVFARRKGRTQPLTAAELEMMNLTGDGNGFDMISLGSELRDQIPTANFFQRKGYEANPVAISHNTVARLLAVTDARMDKEAQLAGAKEMAAAFLSLK